MLKVRYTMKDAASLDNIGQAVLACLKEVPFVQKARLRHPAGDAQPDWVVEADIDGEEWSLVVCAKRSGQPRLAREATNALYRDQRRFRNPYPVFAAPYVSPAAAEVCRREGVGYVDLAGNCRLSFGRVHIEREGRPNPFAQKRDLRSLYSPKATRVLRVLLHPPLRTWTLSSLAREADASVGHAHNVKERLADREWIRKEVGGVRLHEPEALLLEWAANHHIDRSPRQECYSAQSVGDIEAAIGRRSRERALPCALTGFSGAERVAPHVRYQRVHAYVSDTMDELPKGLGLKPVSSGANVVLLTPGDEGVFYGASQIGGVSVVSPVQLYLDLRAIGGRGEEAAEFLLEEALRKQW